jgi:hypothetical protein
MTEHETEWEHKDKMWTYLIFAFLFVLIVVVLNVVWKSPKAVEEALHSFLGLPGAVLAGILAAVGALIFWLGLKMEPDWPEAVGAFMIAGAIAWFEWLVGWGRLELGGLVVVPYILPVLVFVLLLIYAVRNSK